MTELALILGINLCGLAFAGALARSNFGSNTNPPTLQRLDSAVARATQSFLGRGLRLVAIEIALIALFTVGLNATGLGVTSSGLELAVWTGLGLLLGAATAYGAAHVASHVALRAASRTVTASRTSLNQALAASIRGAGVTGIAIECMSLLGVTALFGFIYSIKGGFALEPTAARGIAADVVPLLPGYALGCAAAALVLGSSASRYHVASSVGAHLAGERDAGLEPDDARNPALVAALVGDHAGLAVSRAMDSFVSASTSNVAALIVGALALEANPGLVASPLALVALPLVIRSFGVIASGFGIMVVRTNDGDAPASALWRGQLTTAIIAVGGVSGTALWLLGEHYATPFLCAGAIAIAASSTIAHGAHLNASRKFTSVRESIDSTRNFPPLAIVQGLGAGLEAAVVPTGAIGLVMVVSYYFGVSSGLAAGGQLGLVVALMAILSTGPYMLSVASFGPITDNARGVASMNAESLGADARRVTGRLGDAGFSASAVAQTYFIVTGGATALLLALSLPSIAGTEGGQTAAIALDEPAVLWSGALGAALLLAFSGRALRATVRAARTVAMEVERQLRGFPREGGVAIIPADYTPSYRSCVEASARSATEKLLVPVSLAVAVPIALGVGLRTGLGSAGIAAQGLVSFVVVAALTGLALALALEGLRTTLAAARRAASQRGTQGYHSAVSANAVAEMLGSSAGPAAHILARAAAVAALVVAPFLS